MQLAVIIFRNESGKILLQFRDSNAPTMPLQWSFFGGEVDADETVEEAMMREAMEELDINIAPEDLRLLATEQHTDELTRTVHFYEYTKPIRWNDISIHEGAGAAFLSKEEVATMQDATETAKYFVAKYA